LSIREYVDRMLIGEGLTGFTTPIQLADKLERNASEALALLDTVSSNAPTLECEKADIKAWAYLGYYFADKLRAGVCYEMYKRTGDSAQKQKALNWLMEPHAATHWENLIAITKSHYVEQPLMHLGKTPFSWELFRPQIMKD